MEYDSEITGKGGPDRPADRIETLLGKYFEGATSLEEEKRLREFFTSGQPVPQELQYARVLFGFFSEAAGEVPQRTTSPTTPERKVRLRQGGMRIVYAALSAAALIAVGVLLFTGHGRVNEKVVYCYVNGVPVTDLELALDYTGRALEQVSATMQTPVDEARSALGGLSQLEVISALEGIINSNE